MDINHELLKKAYSVEEFQKNAGYVINEIQKQLFAANLPETQKTIDYISPEDSLRFGKKILLLLFLSVFLNLWRKQRHIPFNSTARVIWTSGCCYASPHCFDICLDCMDE